MEDDMVSKRHLKEMMLCVATQHAYDDISGLYDFGPRIIHGERFRFRCYRCNSERDDTLSTTDFSLLLRFYVYSPEYRSLLDDLATGKNELSPKQAGRKYMIEEVQAKRKAQRRKAS